MRILSIDGGGIRGILPAMVCAFLEERTQRPTCELFDLIAGTSTGGLLALALTVPSADRTAPRWRAEDIVDLYRCEGHRIFSRSVAQRLRSLDGLVDERYDHAALCDVLDRYLGGATLDQALTRVFVTTYDLVARRPRFFKSWHDDDSVPMPLAARATSAAPTYFEPVEDGATALVDGGVCAINPAMCAYAEAVRLRPGAPVRLLSLGTGGQTRAISYERAKDWGMLDWARPILDVVFDAACDTIDYQLAQLLGDQHLRLQPKLVFASDDMGDASPGNLAMLEETARQLMAEHASALDELAGALAAA